LNRTVPVIFDWGLDYKGSDDLQPMDLICLLPQEPYYLSGDLMDFSNTAECFRLSRRSFYKMVTEGQSLTIPKRKSR